MIYTSYFENMKNIPDYIIPVAICLKTPDWYEGRQYKKLAPKYKFFQEWKKNHDNNYYIEHYQKEVLDNLTPEEVIKDLIVDINKDVCLLCYEKPSDFCHRHLVSKWFREHHYYCEELQNDY